VQKITGLSDEEMKCLTNPEYKRDLSGLSAGEIAELYL